MIRISVIVGLLFFTSCSSYINRVHKQLDREDRRQGRVKPSKYRNKKNDNFDLYRQGGREFISGNRKKRVSSAQNRYAPPSTRRQYKPETAAKKRYTAEDLNDNGNQASLWASDDNQLFQKIEKKRNGDIILINVLGRLKGDITMELKRAFPDPPKRRKKRGAKGEKGKEEKPDAKTAEAAEPSPDGKKVHDKISSVVIEEINSDHLLLRGRKHLLYKNRKRLIEIQALISRKDIDDENSIHSDNILESSVNVLR
ncbi:MAG: flagellar basal body L-ring protein FlgH [Bacteriovoracaceae bacterium]|nr:flagellar basal body L-ring protein FlgH [Bacteriovoracaceae bacterium]